MATWSNESWFQIDGRVQVQHRPYEATDTNYQDDNMQARGGSIVM